MALLHQTKLTLSYELRGTNECLLLWFDRGMKLILSTCQTPMDKLLPYNTQLSAIS